MRRTRSSHWPLIGAWWTLIVASGNEFRRVDAGVATATRRQRASLGGAAGNARLTSIVALILLVGLAVEGATIPWIRPLLSVHIFLGMLLLGPVALKLGSAGYRFVRYYAGGREYVRQGPPAPLMRVIVAPILVFSTLALFGTGVGLLVFHHGGALSGLHKASFIVWFGAMTIHVLVYIRRATASAFADLSGRHPPGRALRLAGVAVALAVGVGVAAATYPLAAPWFHHRHGEKNELRVPLSRSDVG